MTPLEEKLQSFSVALEREEGIKPEGTAQAELRGLLALACQVVDVQADQMKELRARVQKLEDPNALTSVLGRIERKLDQLLAAREPSVFERVFGRTA